MHKNAERKKLIQKNKTKNTNILKSIVPIEYYEFLICDGIKNLAHFRA